MSSSSVGAGACASLPPATRRSGGRSVPVARWITSGAVSMVTRRPVIRQPDLRGRYASVQGHERGSPAASSRFNGFYGVFPGIELRRAGVQSPTARSGKRERWRQRAGVKTAILRGLGSCPHRQGDALAREGEGRRAEPRGEVGCRRDRRRASPPIAVRKPLTAPTHFFCLIDLACHECYYDGPNSVGCSGDEVCGLGYNLLPAMHRRGVSRWAEVRPEKHALCRLCDARRLREQTGALREFETTAWLAVRTPTVRPS